MNTRAIPSFFYLGIISTVALLIFCFAQAGAQSTKSQVVYLPDPTPRPLDPDIKYRDDGKPQAHAAELEKQQNLKRRALVEWGANELVLLSQHLQEDVAQHPTAAPTAAQAASAEKIEQLAKNLKAAVKAE